MDETNDQKGSLCGDINQIKYSIEENTIFIEITTTERPIINHGVLDLEIIVASQNNQEKIDINLRADNSYSIWFDKDKDGIISHSEEFIENPIGALEWSETVRFAFPIFDYFEEGKIDITKAAYSLGWVDIYRKKI